MGEGAGNRADFVASTEAGHFRCGDFTGIGGFEVIGQRHQRADDMPGGVAEQGKAAACAHE